MVKIDLNQGSDYWECQANQHPGKSIPKSIRMPPIFLHPQSPDILVLYYRRYILVKGCIMVAAFKNENKKGRKNDSKKAVQIFILDCPVNGNSGEYLTINS